MSEMGVIRSGAVFEEALEHNNHAVFTLPHRTSG
jgi:hypothetical protein